MLIIKFVSFVPAKYLKSKSNKIGPPSFLSCISVICSACPFFLFFSNKSWKFSVIL